MMKRMARLAAAMCLGGLLGAAAGDSVEQAQRLYDRTDYAGAIARLNGANDAASLQLTGESYLMLAEYKKATEALERAAAADDRSSRTFLYLGRAYGRRAETAFAVAAPGFAVKARQSFEKAVELDPKNWEALDDLFEYYLEAPGFLGGGLDKATRIAGLIGQHDEAQASFDRGKIAEQRKEFDAAEANLRRAVDLAPGRAGNVVELAGFLARRGRFAESDQTFARALQAAPNTPRLVYMRAHTLIECNRNLPEARDLLKRYLAMNLSPDDPSRRDAEKLLRKVSGS